MLFGNEEPYGTLYESVFLFTLLDVGNNLITDLYTIFPLKESPKLIILDLAGNDVIHTLEYRLFVIFHLSKLKVLDGASVSAKELSVAKELLLGKLTVELLGEKIGHFHFKVPYPSVSFSHSYQ